MCLCCLFDLLTRAAAVFEELDSVFSGAFGVIFFSAMTPSPFRPLGSARSRRHHRASRHRFHVPCVTGASVVGHRSERDVRLSLDVTRSTSMCDARHTSSSGSGIGSGRGVHAPHRRASSTTRAWVGPSPRKSSRMKGSVFAWSSHTPRPQKRQTPIAVRRQCQQSILADPPDLVDQCCHVLSTGTFNLPTLNAWRTTRSNPSRSSRNARSGVLATMLAVLGTSRRRAISPK